MVAGILSPCLQHLLVPLFSVELFGKFSASV